MTAADYEPECISPDGLRRILAHLPAGAQAGPMCDLTAHVYLNGKATLVRGTGRGFRADLSALHRDVLKAKLALDPVRIDLLPMIRLFGGQNALPRFSALVKEIVWFEETLAVVDSIPMRRMPKSHPYFLTLAIGLLIPAFERATKRRATHSLHRDGQYMGEPLSPFGKFVVAFFAEVDPGLERRTIGSAIRAAFKTFERGGDRLNE